MAKNVLHDLDYLLLSALHPVTKHPVYEENWKNKSRDQKKLPLIEKIKPKCNKNYVQLLPNGNISGTSINNLILQNTCAFDAVVQAFAVAYKNYDSVRVLLDTQDSSFAVLVKAVSDENMSVDVLQLRAEILSNYFEKGKRSDMTIVTVDCSCNVTRTFEGLLLNEYHSAKDEKECSVCDFKTERICPILPLSILILAEDGITELEKAASSMLNEKTKSSNHQCSGEIVQITERYNLSEHLITFEISCNVKITLDMVQNKKYGIVAGIEYVPGVPRGGLGHYKAHCKSGNKWYCYDDLSPKVTKTNINKPMQIDVLIYAKI